MGGGDLRRCGEWGNVAGVRCFEQAWIKRSFNGFRVG